MGIHLILYFIALVDFISYGAITKFSLFMGLQVRTILVT